MSELLADGENHVEFQGTIANEDGSPMGSIASVQSVLTRMFPCLVFEWSPSGITKLAQMDARGVELPPMVRRVLEAQPSNYCGGFDDGLLLAGFNIGHEEPVVCIWATIGGKKPDVEIALSLFEQLGWRIQSPEQLAVQVIAPNQPIHLTRQATLFVEDKQFDAPPRPSE